MLSGNRMMNTQRMAWQGTRRNALLTVVDIHKPGRFPTRVFYTRQWKDPTAKFSAKPGCALRRLMRFVDGCAGTNEFWLDGGMLVTC